MTASTFTDALLIAAAVALVLVRQFRTQQIDHGGRWWLIPAVLVFFGLRRPGLLDTHHGTESVALIAVELLTGLVMGAAWAWTTKMWTEPDGTVWARGTKATAAVWVLGLGVRLGVVGAAALAGVHLGTGALLLALAASLLVRSGVLVWRAGRIAPSYGVSGAGTPVPAWKDRV
ncbi:DUF1453 domain-containing protein [Streptomyces sp. NBC_00344]|uniref:DUF1453 domain-containing protein n=1 Tax=Streptomyces sp. NBC_00344 TaxID=2975720 RepID=UPI002E251EC1